MTVIVISMSITRPEKEITARKHTHTNQRKSRNSLWRHCRSACASPCCVLFSLLRTMYLGRVRRWQEIGIWLNFIRKIIWIFLDDTLSCLLWIRIALESERRKYIYFFRHFTSRQMRLSKCCFANVHCGLGVVVVVKNSFIVESLSFTWHITSHTHPEAHICARNGHKFFFFFSRRFSAGVRPPLCPLCC